MTTTMSLMRHVHQQSLFMSDNRAIVGDGGRGPAQPGPGRKIWHEVAASTAGLRYGQLPVNSEKLTLVEVQIILIRLLRLHYPCNQYIHIVYTYVCLYVYTHCVYTLCLYMCMHNVSIHELTHASTLCRHMCRHVNPHCVCNAYTAIVFLSI